MKPSLPCVEAESANHVTSAYESRSPALPLHTVPSRPLYPVPSSLVGLTSEQLWELHSAYGTFSGDTVHVAMADPAKCGVSNWSTVLHSWPPFKPTV